MILAFKIQSKEDVLRAVESPAEFILFDSSLGSGETMDVSILKDCPRAFFLAGGLDPSNVSGIIDAFRPEGDASPKTAPNGLAGVDVSSGIETDGKKDPQKMRAFMQAVKNSSEP